jgi:hypothetical protein
VRNFNPNDLSILIATGDKALDNLVLLLELTCSSTLSTSGTNASTESVDIPILFSDECKNAVVQAV